MMELQHLEGKAKPITCDRNETVIGRVGRSLPASVSRKACVGRAEGNSLRVTSNINCCVKRHASKAVERYMKGAEFKLANGDELYLGKVEAACGLRLQACGKKRSAGSNSATELAKQPKFSQTDRPRSTSGAAAAQDDAEPLLFTSMHLVFWHMHHTKILQQRAVSNGAVIEQEITPRTNYAIVDLHKSTCELLQELVSFDRNTLPKELRFVKSDFLTESLAAKELQTPDRFVVDHRRHQQERSPTPLTDAAAAPASAAASRPGGTAGQQTAQHAAGSAGGAAAAASVPAVPTGTAFADCGPAMPDHHRFTGSRSGRQWGAGGCWLEPYEESKVKDTLQRLEQFWHRVRALQDSKPRNEFAEPADADGGTYGETVSSDEQAAGGATAVSNSICEHRACAAVDTCVIRHMETAKQQYSGRAAQFRIKAAQNAITVLSKLTKPLRTTEDVQDLNLGTKSTDKVVEIMTTGRLERNEVQAADPEFQAKMLFRDIWGCGDTVCEKWFQQGCRTLDDVRQRTDLNVRQKVGLKYFDDFQKRIPREEVAEFETGIRAEVAEVLDLWDPDGECLFAYCLGSYCRGKPATGDVDMVITVPEVRQSMPANELMNKLLPHLQQKGILAGDQAFGVQGVSHAATWLGVGRLPSRPDGPFRRIDLKIWAYDLQASAINHFVGSQSFARALRWWARFHTDEETKQEFPDASGFKLSEHGLCPIRWLSGKKRYLGEQDYLELGSPRRITCETDIFERMNLDYVPPFMRFFHQGSYN